MGGCSHYGSWVGFRGKRIGFGEKGIPEGDGDFGPDEKRTAIGTASSHVGDLLIFWFWPFISFWWVDLEMNLESMRLGGILLFRYWGLKGTK